MNHPTGVPTAMYAEDPGPKSRHAAEIKSLVLYGPGAAQKRFRHVLDYSRLMLAFPSCDMLHAALEHILATFEVVDIRNFFSSPGRIGERFVEVLVVVHVGGAGGKNKTPFVCE